MLESAVPSNWFLQSISLLTGEQKWPDIFNALPYTYVFVYTPMHVQIHKHGSTQISQSAQVPEQKIQFS